MRAYCLLFRRKRLLVLLDIYTDRQMYESGTSRMSIAHSQLPCDLLGSFVPCATAEAVVIRVPFWTVIRLGWEVDMWYREPLAL